jgi:hypothetical protein
MGLSDPTFMLPTGTASTGDNTFSATGFTPITGAGVTSGGTIDAGSGGIQGLIDKFTSNPQMLLAAAPLVMQMLGGQGPYPAEKSLQTQATNLGSEGQALAGYVNSGTLPPGAQANVDASRHAAEAGIRSAAARTGTSGSTMEAQQLGSAREQSAGQQFLIANDLLQSGLRASGASASINADVLRAEMARDQQFTNALSSFARGLGGYSPGWQQPTYSVAG